MAHGPPARKQTQEDLDTSEEDELPPPPDGGWGWVVVLASFLIHIVTDGLTYSFGIFNKEFLHYFNSNKGYTAMIPAILVGVTLCSGPISSSFVNKYGCRPVTIVGAILASASLFASSFAQNVGTLIFTIGIGTGLGLGLIYLPAIVSVTMYFEKYRSLATGIAVCGSGIGTFIFSPLTDILIKALGWRGAMLVCAAIVLNCILFGALFKPLKPVKKPLVSTNDPVLYDDSGMYNGEGHGSNLYNVEPSHNITVPAVRQHRRKSRNHSFRVPSVHVISEGGAVGGGSIGSGSGGGDSQLIRSQSVGHQILSDTSYGEKKSFMNGSFNALKVGKSDGIRSTLSQPLLHNTSSESDQESKTLHDSQKFWKSGTLSRPDIFYQGSLYNIPNYRSHGELRSDAEGYGSLRRIEENEIHTPSEDICCGCIPADTHETFVEMMNFGLLKDPIFIIFIVSNFCTSVGFNVPYVHLAAQAEELGLTAQDGSYLVAIIGIANTFGRIILGYLSDKPWVNRLWVYNVCLSCCGIATALVVICDDYPKLVIYSIVFGFTIGAYVGLTSVILVDLLGLDKLTNAFGLLLLFQGVASLIGPPIAGALYDMTFSYNPGFFCAGIFIFLSGIMLFVIPPMQRCLRRRDERRAHHNGDAHHATGAVSL